MLLVIGLLMGLGLKVHVGHVLGLEHDLDLGVAQAISLVGIASLGTRPDISFAINMLGRYQSNLGLYHWKGTKKLRYLQGTKNHMLTYKNVTLR